MSHTLTPSSSHQTFDLDVGLDSEADGDEPARPMSAGNESQRTKRASSTYGVALTSTPSQDERAALPSQQRPNAWKRKSAPGSEYADFYADLMTTSASTTQLDELLRLRGPGDRGSVQSTSYNDNSKRRSQYLEDQFKSKDSVAMSGMKERVGRQSPVIAELKTNVIIKDEFTLVTDLSYHLAQRYARPDSCIMIRVDHSACLALGGNFEPCYMLTIHAVPSQMGPTTNKRNASLIQNFMENILSVKADRGIVTFVAIAEENLATNGQTVLGEMERQERRNSINDPNVLKSAIKDATRRSMTFPNSNPKPNGNHKSNGNLATGSTNSPSVTPPPPAQLNDKPSSSDINGRPSTAHGGFDGLRMNGVSTELLTANTARLPNGRPKSLGAQPTPNSIQDALKSEPLPHLVSQQSQRASMQRSSMIKRPSNSATNGTTATTVQPTTKSNGALAPRPVQVPRTKSSPSGPTPARPSTAGLPTETRAKNTYLDGVSSLTSKDATPIIAADDDDDMPLAKTAAGKANTAAKRRSTITATPSLPASKENQRSKTKGPLKPPPVPDETRSMSSRLSKRKSFLRMFKRQSVPAWYEQ